METQSHQFVDSIDLNKIKEFIISKGGKTKYSELFNAFRHLLENDGAAGKY